jgi:hypothetical protein
MQTEFKEQLKPISAICATLEGNTGNKGQKCLSLYKTHYLYNDKPQELDEPEILKVFYFDEVLNGPNGNRPTDEEINHVIELNDWSRWNKELIKDKEPVEVSENIYYDMLNCLPPKNWKGTYFEVGEAHHHDNNGKAIHRAFWSEDSNTRPYTRYFTGYPKS